MSLLPAMNRLSYDDATYRQTVKQSMTQGQYVLSPYASTHCDRCMTLDPGGDAGAGSAPSCKTTSEVDVESDLRNIIRPATRAPSGKYRGGGGPATVCGGVPISQASQALSARSACRMIPSIDTRLTTPPCTLRGTGWSRFEWLCQDPQESALMPFDSLVNTGIVMKDNHRPHLATPLDPTLALPPASSRCVKPINALSIPCGTLGQGGARIGPDGEAPLVMWRTCAEVDRINTGI
jgi:hypothetical protein